MSVDTRVKESASTNALRRFMIRLTGGVTPEEYFKGKHRAYASGFDDGADEPALTLDGKPLGHGYRRMRTRKRDLTDVSQDRAIEASYRIWNTNPLGKAIIEIIMDYVLGEGPELIAQNEDVGAVVDGFWKDPVNKLEDELAESLTKELSIFGELIIPAFVQTGEDVGAVLSGRVRLGTIDPSQIGVVSLWPAYVCRRSVFAMFRSPWIMRNELSQGKGPRHGGHLRIRDTEAMLR